MSEEKKKKWDSEWVTMIKPRVQDRSNYFGGPAAGKGIWQKYTEYYARATEGIKEPKVLVLGQTPELRDHALEMGAKVTSIDFNEQAMANMTAIMKHKDSPNENRVIGNWLDMPFEDNSFDFIWGDGITNNVLFDEHSKLFSELHRVLKPDGHLLLRDMLFDEEQEIMSIEEMIKWAHANNIHKFDLWVKIYCYTDFGHWDPDKHYVDMKMIYDKLAKDFFGKGILTDDEEYMLREFMSGTVKSTFITRQEFEKAIGEKFDLMETGVVDDYLFCKYFNFFFARPKFN